MNEIKKTNPMLKRKIIVLLTRFEASEYMLAGIRGIYL